MKGALRCVVVLLGGESRYKKGGGKEEIGGNSTGAVVAPVDSKQLRSLGEGLWETLKSFI
jgi:hypothetical protein